MSGNSCLDRQSQIWTCLKFLSRSRALLILCACVALGAGQIYAYPINFAVSGTLGPEIGPGTPLFDAGSPFTMSGTMDSTANSIPSLLINIGGIGITATNAPVGIIAGNPGTLSISASISLLNSPLTFTAIAKVTPALIHSFPYAFGAETIIGNSTDSNGSAISYTYKATSGQQAIASGTVNASTTAPTISANSSFTFSYQSGGPLPVPSQTLNVSSNPAVNFTVSAADSWLTVAAPTGKTPQHLSVTVTPGSLPAGTYNSTITISSTQGVAPPPIPVTFTITPAPPTITASPNPLPQFSYQLLGAAPGAQSISLNGGAGLSFTASGPSWLTVTPSGTTPGPISVSVNTTGLTAQDYSGSISISVTGAANPSISVPVSLHVTAAPTLSSPTSSLSFAFQTGGATPPSQNVSVSSSGGSVAFTAVASGGSWLSAGAGGTTPGSVSVSVNPGSLGTGTYNGTVTISSTQASNNVVIPVTLTVSAQAVLLPSPSSLAFTYTIGGASPSGQGLHIAVSGGPGLPYTLATSGGSWLSLTSTSGTTPGDTTVSVNPGSLAAGVYNGSVTITAAGAANSGLSVPVTLTVSAQPVLSASPAALTFSYQIGAAIPAAQPLSVNASGSAALSYTLATSGGSWLATTPGGGTTNTGSVNVSVNPTGLTAGTYSGFVIVTAAGAANSPLKVPVMLTVNSAATVTLAPSLLRFIYQLGGTTPPAQIVSVAGTAGLNYSAAASTSTGSGWLSVGPGGTTPGNLSVTVNPASLGAGTYMGTINVTAVGAANNPQSVSVILTVSAEALISATPGTLNFTAAQGANAPAAQNVAIAASGGPLNFTVASSTTGNWLLVTPGNGTTPANLSVSVDASHLAPGTYKGTIIVSAVGSSGTAEITANLTVTAPGPALDAFTDAASYATGSTSPAAIVTLWGTSIGPKTAVVFQVGDGGTVASTLADTRVFFDDIPATLLMVSDLQINAIVPYGVAGKSSAMVHVEYQGVKSNSMQVNIAPVAPAVFTVDLSGKGQGAILNHDYKVNSAANPADKGSVIMIYGEGGGQTDPPGVDGTVTGLIIANLTQPYKVQIGGIDADVDFAGAAPSLVSGVMQINAHIPNGVSSGNVPIVITIGGVSSQLGVTVAVR